MKPRDISSVPHRHVLASLSSLDTRVRNMGIQEIIKGQGSFPLNALLLSWCLMLQTLKVPSGGRLEQSAGRQGRERMLHVKGCSMPRLFLSARLVQYLHSCLKVALYTCGVCDQMIHDQELLTKTNT